ncbi:MAG: cytochrome c3 family protein [Acidobacteria bacterium]|nr:cytochrome c3 family protein [Acidobacteriota bacterium]
MKTRSILIVALTLVFAMSASAQLAKTNLGAHNIGGTNGCKSCHAPHNGSVATGLTDQSTGKILLWDRAISQVVYGTYTSPTMKNPVTEIGGTTLPTNTDDRIYSLLCMSCHDATITPSIAIGATKNIGSGDAATSSYGLRNDHPVNMAHNATLQPTLNADTIVTSGTDALALFGANKTVQCASCHEPHNNTNGDFLRIANTNGTALCLKCHK